jgi:hypothetical protein
MASTAAERLTYMVRWTWRGWEILEEGVSWGVFYETLDDACEGLTLVVSAGKATG